MEDVVEDAKDAGVGKRRGESSGVGNDQRIGECSDTCPESLREWSLRHDIRCCGIDRRIRSRLMFNCPCSSLLRGPSVARQSPGLDHVTPPRDAILAWAIGAG
jgi:hypothetical protein